MIAAARQFPDLRFVLLNSFANPLTRDKYEVTVTPTLLLFKDGKLQGRMRGLFAADAIAEWIRDNAPGMSDGEECDFCMAVSALD